MHRAPNPSTTRPGLLPLAIIALSVFGVLPAAGQTIGEDFKLLASDGAAGDELGNSVAIANGVVAVGAWLSNANGTHSGSAYLFDASTGNQLFKLLPDDIGADALFGRSIAVAGGLVGVGAHGATNDNGTSAGSA